VKYNTKGNPAKTGVYQVDRGALGTPFRFYNADTDAWSLTVYSAAEAVAVKDVPSAIGFLPWVGPVKVEDAPVVALVSGPAMKVTKVGNTKVGLVQAKAPKSKVEKPTKVKHADGTIFFREDRQKWVVVVDGKQPAARPTKEGVVNWLATKHPEVKPTFLE
jgi:hypothetical protein